MEERERGVTSIVGILPTMKAQFTRKWQTEVYAADACESGYGAVTASSSQQLVSTHGRVSERSRFRMQRGGKSAREHALHSARQDFNNVFRDPDTVWCQSSLVECPDD